jgi:arylsulfatase A-like enzyme
MKSSSTRCWVVLLVLTLTCILGFANERPHIILMLADDLGWGDVSYHDGNISTPNIDSLAGRGVQLDQFYVLPVCTPTRAALMTGRYPIRLGLQYSVIRPWATHGLPLDEQTLAEGLRTGGYSTAIVGKWHLGHADPRYLPLKRGFDQQYGHYNGALDYFTHMRDGGLDWHKNDKASYDRGYTTDLIGQEASRIIEAHDPDKPLFLYIPFNAPHDPLQATEEHLQRNKHIKEKNRQLFAGMVTSMDDAVGRIVESANQHLPKENTLIFFLSDNGGITEFGSNGPLRAKKSTLYEGGIRVPAIAVWDGKLKAGSMVKEQLHVTDLYPTLLHLAGIKVEQRKPLDGFNVWPTIAQGKKSPHQEILINITPFYGGIRMGKWKLVHNGAATSSVTSPAGPETWELFDISKDPYEKTDLHDKFPKVVKRLKTRLAMWGGEAVPPHLTPNSLPADFVAPEVWGTFE